MAIKIVYDDFTESVVANEQEAETEILENFANDVQPEQIHDVDDENITYGATWSVSVEKQ